MLLNLCNENNAGDIIKAIDGQLNFIKNSNFTEAQKTKLTYGSTYEILKWRESHPLENTDFTKWTDKKNRHRQA